jgi:hypothetical protein
MDYLRAAVTRAVAIETLVVLVVTGVIAIIITWPVAANFGTIITGPPGNDQLGYQQEFWFAANHGLALFRDGFHTLWGAPFGGVVPALPNLTLAATLIPAAILTKLFGSIVAYNIMTLAGLALTGAAMYLLCRWIGLGIGPASWAGLAYMVMPYHLLAAQSFVTLVPYWCFPLLLMALLAWVRKPTWANGISTVLAVILATITFPYFLVMALLMVLVAIVVSYVRRGRADGWARALAAPAILGGALIALVLVPLRVIAAINPATEGQSRSLDEVTNLGPTLSEFIIPPRNSGFFAGFDGTHWYGVGSVGGERLVYIGAAALILLAVGLVAGIIWRHSLPPLQRALILSAPFMILVLVVASLRTPYPIGGAELTMPSRWIFEAAPYIRAFGRFVIASGAVAIVLGALGLKLVMGRIGGNGGKAVLASALVLTGMEGYTSLPLVTAAPGALPEGKSTENLATWVWLAQQKDDGIVFEQPEIGNTSLQRVYSYGVTKHGHPALNIVGAQGEPGNFISQVLGPPTPRTATLLATAGVKYVVFNAWAYRSLEQTPPRYAPEGYKVAKRTSDGEAVWRVTAPPADGFVTFHGMDTQRLEYTGSGWRNWRWMFTEGFVRAYVEEPGTYRATFRAAPAGPSQVVTATSPDGFSSSITVNRRADYALTIKVPERGAKITLEARPGAGPNIPTVQFTPWLLERVS